MYKVTISYGYTDVHFGFNDMQQASDFAWECIEQTLSTIKVTLSRPTEETEENRNE